MRIEVYVNTTDYDTANEFATMLRDVYPDDVNGAVVLTHTERLTVMELENSGYNEAAQRVLAGDMVGACIDVLTTEREHRYRDDEARRVCLKACRVLSQAQA